jgi:hypothetical protein
MYFEGSGEHIFVTGPIALNSTLAQSIRLIDNTKRDKVKSCKHEVKTSTTSVSKGPKITIRVSTALKTRSVATIVAFPL